MADRKIKPEHIEQAIKDLGFDDPEVLRRWYDGWVQAVEEARARQSRGTDAAE